MHEALGIASLADLRAAASAGRLREVKGFGRKSEAAILAAIETFRAQAPVMRLVMPPMKPTPCACSRC